MIDRFHRLASLCTVFLLLVSLGSRAGGVPPDMTDQSLQVMCQRGLAESAAEYCRAQYELLSEQAPARARWAMRYMECQSQSALRTTTVDANDKWRRVAKIESDYRERYPEDPRLPWLAWQVARAELLHAQQSVAKWLATPAATVQQEQALLSVRKVQSLIDDLENDIKVRLPLSNVRGPQATQATSRELQELELDGALIRCEALLVRAKCYPSQSPDHLAALADVDSAASEVFRQAAPDWSSRDELLVAQATAGLEVGKRRQSLDLLIKTLLGQSTEGPTDPNIIRTPVSPPSELARIRAGSALVEALCADAKPDEAAEFAKELAKNFSGPEVDMAALRVAIARMKLLPAASRAAELKTIIADTQAIGQRYGGYWRSRSEALLVAEASTGSTLSTSTASASTLPTSPSTSLPVKDGAPKPASPAASTPATNSNGMSELLTIEVRQLLAGGQTIAAIAKLRSASILAESAKRSDEAIQLAVEAARLMQKEKQWIEAADLLAPLALAHPDIKDAAAAHALAAWCVAQSLKDSAPQAMEKRYEELLRDQLDKWPDAPETLKGEEYLSTWLTSKKRYEELTNMWLQRAARVTNVDRQRMALEHWLGTLLARVPKAKITSQIDQLAKLVAAGKPAGCQSTAQIVLIAAAMLTSPVTQLEAEQIAGCRLPDHQLQQPAGDETLLSALMALDAVYRTNANDAQTAIQTVELAQLTSTVNLAWCRAIVLAADELPESQLAQWSTLFQQVQLPSGESWQATPVLKMTKLRLEQLSAGTTESNAAALVKIRQLASENATDPNLQLTLAAAIMQSAVDPQGRAERQAEATKLVKRVAVGTKKDSEAHLRARWLEARWSVGRGDRATAAQIAKLMLGSREIQPAWWKARFESLPQAK